jgi:transcriptional regulator with XRE-family HTH domain
MQLNKKDGIYIGDIIKRWRRLKGISQEELALRSRIDRSFISELERNQSSPSIFTVLKLAKGLGTCPGQFLVEIHRESDFDQIFEELM